MTAELRRLVDGLKTARIVSSFEVADSNNDAAKACKKGQAESPSLKVVRTVNGNWTANVTKKRMCARRSKMRRLPIGGLRDGASTLLRGL
jgi:hypothetical protein